jgi:hypothetical protein
MSSISFCKININGFLQIIVGATHVRWNKVSQHILASAHEGDIKVWDQRKGTAPVQYISAHLAKVSFFFFFFFLPNGFLGKNSI